MAGIIYFTSSARGS